MVILNLVLGCMVILAEAISVNLPIPDLTQIKAGYLLGGGIGALYTGTAIWMRRSGMGAYLRDWGNHPGWGCQFGGAAVIGGWVLSPLYMPYRILVGMLTGKPQSETKA